MFLRYIYLESILSEHGFQEGVAQVHRGIEFLIIDPPPPTLWVGSANKEQPKKVNILRFSGSIRTVKVNCLHKLP